MMRQTLGVILSLLLPLTTWAQRPTGDVSSSGPVSHSRLEWTPVMQIGMDVRFERDEDQSTKARTMTNFGLGLEHGHWLGELEYAAFSQDSGNSTLSVGRKFESALGWLYWEALDSRYFAPYIGAGLGALHETVNTTLLGNADRDQGPWDILAAGALGVRLVPKTTFWVSAEGRLYNSPRLDPDPEVGVLLRIGLVF